MALRTFGEINVRTYVTGDGIPGVWFLSLDAASAVTVAAGRRALHLPYHTARITTACARESYAYHLERTDPHAAPARFTAEARIGSNARIAAQGSLEHRLVERYCFFTVDSRGRTLRGDVLHPPWPLHDATATIAENTLLAAADIGVSAHPPLVHASPGVSTRARALVRA